MSTAINILLLEDEPFDVVLVKRALFQQFPEVVIEHVESRGEFLNRLDSGAYDVVLCDGGVPGCEGVSAFHLARERRPNIPFIYISGFDQPNRDIAGLKGLGVSDFVSKSDLSSLGDVIRVALRGREVIPAHQVDLLNGYERLVGVVRELSLARDMPAMMTVVRRAARALTGADGATFVLRDGNQCHYADEDAIGPLWKGQRFPMETCISGWAMMNRQPAVVEDIFTDPRIPVAVYEPTFVRSVVMVPIRAADPIGAIGTYWAHRRLPESPEIRLLQALADTTAVAMENVRVYQELEARVRERTTELEAFTYAVSHDLRAPVRHVRAFASILVEDHAATMGADAKHVVGRITAAATQMGDMIEGLLALSRTATAAVTRRPVDLAELAREIAEVNNGELSRDRQVSFFAPDTLSINADLSLMRSVLQNLLGNAWKFTSRRDVPRVELGLQAAPGAPPAYFVRDNGAGFDQAYASKLFRVFQRLHSEDDFPGTGVGLASVHRVISKHGGRIWAESQPGNGATFFFTLGEAAAAPTS